MDYGTYRLNWKERIMCMGTGLLISVAAARLLYRSWYGIALAVIWIPLCIKKEKKRLSEVRRQQLILEFKDAMQSVASALLAGYSMENAWNEAEKEIVELYGIKAYMAVELQQINAAVRMNQPIEKELRMFAERSGCEDIVSFAEVFQFAKRSGGDFGKIIQTTVNRISDKIEVEREVATVIAGKKMEQKVMNMVPAFILFYFNLTSPDFLQPLYGNVFGITVMSIACMVYLGTMKLAEKITEIRV